MFGRLFYRNGSVVVLVPVPRCRCDSETWRLGPDTVVTYFPFWPAPTRHRMDVGACVLTADWLRSHYACLCMLFQGLQAPIGRELARGGSSASESRRVLVNALAKKKNTEHEQVLLSKLNCTLRLLNRGRDTKQSPFAVEEIHQFSPSIKLVNPGPRKIFSCIWLNIRLSIVSSSMLGDIGV